MRRVALEDVILSDGTILPKGDMIALSTHNLRDPDLYPNPDTWNGRRFLRIRENVPGKENHDAGASRVRPSLQRVPRPVLRREGDENHPRPYAAQV